MELTSLVDVLPDRNDANDSDDGRGPRGARRPFGCVALGIPTGAGADEGDRGGRGAERAIVCSDTGARVALAGAGPTEYRPKSVDGRGGDKEYDSDESYTSDGLQLESAFALG